MAVTQLYAPRTWRQIKFKPPSSTTEFLYLFRSNVPATEVSELGQTEITGGTPTSGIIITAAKYPSPPRVFNRVKRIRSICATDSLATAKAKGWVLVKKAAGMKKRTQSFDGLTATSKGSLLVFVPTKSGAADGNGTFNYAWRMPKQQYRKLDETELTALKISLPGNADWKDLCLGVGTKNSGPRPGRASKVETSTSGSGEAATSSVDTITTFYGHGSTLPDDWVVTDEPIYLEI